MFNPVLSVLNNLVYFNFNLFRYLSIRPGSSWLLLVIECAVKWTWGAYGVMAWLRVCRNGPLQSTPQNLIFSVVTALSGSTQQILADQMNRAGPNMETITNFVEKFGDWDQGLEAAKAQSKCTGIAFCTLAIHLPSLLPATPANATPTQKCRPACSDSCGPLHWLQAP